jgi:hypothetical protein
MFVVTDVNPQYMENCRISVLEFWTYVFKETYKIMDGNKAVTGLRAGRTGFDSQ